jgi:chemotaxis protein MotB
MLASLQGCVSASKHEELKKKYDVARAQLVDGHAKIHTLEEELREQVQQANLLAARIEDAQRQIAVLEQQREENAFQLDAQRKEGQRLTGELAALVHDRSQLKDSTDRLKQALTELSARKAEADRRVAEFRDMLVRFKNLIDAGTLEVRIIDGRMVLALPTDVLFDSGSARLSKIGKEAVQQVGAVLADMGGRRFQVEGHTDNVPIRNEQFPSNWELAAARALVVVRAMMASGMSSAALSAASYGEFHPTATNETVKGRSENRRIEIVLIPDLSSLPGFDELRHAVGER